MRGRPMTTQTQSVPRRSSGPGAGESGSLVTEYGLIAVVGATVASLVVKWATGGAIWQLFDAVTEKVRVLLGA